MTLWVDEHDRIRKFELTGHANFAPYGQDIVCAGVSALSIAAVNGLEHFLSVAPQVEETEGFLTCVLSELDERELEQAQWILQTMRLGIEEIQRTYGQEYVKVEQRRWTPC